MNYINIMAANHKQRRVARAQERLNHLGAGLYLSGREDAMTRKVVAAYQRTRGLKVTGRLNRETEYSLYGEDAQETVAA